MPQRKEYNTKARTEIIAFLENNSSRTVSVGDILEYLDSVDVHANPTTVYRFLDKLYSEKKILRYADADGEKTVYQYVNQDNRCEEHLHLKCRECGRLIHMDCSFAEDFSKHLSDEHNFLLDYNGNILYGICKSCDNKIK